MAPPKRIALQQNRPWPSNRQPLNPKPITVNPNSYLRQGRNAPGPPGRGAGGCRSAPGRSIAAARICSAARRRVGGRHDVRPAVGGPTPAEPIDVRFFGCSVRVCVCVCALLVCLFCVLACLLYVLCLCVCFMCFACLFFVCSVCVLFVCGFAGLFVCLCGCACVLAYLCARSHRLGPFARQVPHAARADEAAGGESGAPPVRPGQPRAVSEYSSDHCVRRATAAHQSAASRSSLVGRDSLP